MLNMTKNKTNKFKKSKNWEYISKKHVEWFDYL